MTKKIYFAIVFSCLCFAVYAQNVTLDMRYNVLTSEPSRDYLNWSAGNRRIHDTYDALSGASAARSTREFDAVRFDTPSSRRYTMPWGIRHLLLFPVASRRYTDNFHLTVREDGGKIKNPRHEWRGIEDFSLKSLRMRGNNSPAPPVLRPEGRGIKPL
jgi:hypothetical protein